MHEMSNSTQLITFRPYLLSQHFQERQKHLARFSRNFTLNNEMGGIIAKKKELAKSTDFFHLTTQSLNYPQIGYRRTSNELALEKV